MQLYGLHKTMVMDLKYAEQLLNTVITVLYKHFNPQDMINKCDCNDNGRSTEIVKSHDNTIIMLLRVLLCSGIKIISIMEFNIMVPRVHNELLMVHIIAQP